MKFQLKTLMQKDLDTEGEAKPIGPSPDVETFILFTHPPNTKGSVVFNVDFIKPDFLMFHFVLLNFQTFQPAVLLSFSSAFTTKVIKNLSLIIWTPVFVTRWIIRFTFKM